MLHVAAYAEPGNALGWHSLMLELLAIHFDFSYLDHNLISGDTNHAFDPAMTRFRRRSAKHNDLACLYSSAQKDVQRTDARPMKLEHTAADYGIAIVAPPVDETEASNAGMLRIADGHKGDR